LRDLYKMYGDWYLAMAGTNADQGMCKKELSAPAMPISGAVQRERAAARDQNYVPIIVALTLIAKDAAHYGIQVDPEPPVATDVVSRDARFDLRLVAETIDVDRGDASLVESFPAPACDAGRPILELHLPAGTAERFSAEIADIPADKWVSWRRHRVEAGETLTSIGKNIMSHRLRLPRPTIWSTARR